MISPLLIIWLPPSSIRHTERIADFKAWVNFRPTQLYSGGYNNFQYADQDAINICFATTQGLHMDMWMAKENGMSFDDFDEQKVVLISDEAHHLNVDTRKKMSADEKSSL